MKTNNKKKVVVSVLALAMGAGLAGSISGSVAWYQYSTRTTAQLQGVSAGTIRDLQVRIGSAANLANANLGWKQDLAKEDIKAYLDSLVTGETKPSATKLNPVTVQTSDLAEGSALATRNIGTNESPVNVPAFSGHPVYQYNNLPAINAALVDDGANSTFNYIQIPLQFKVEDNGTKIEKAVYLVDAFFGDTDTTSDTVDVTPAIRGHLSSSSANALFANKATSTEVSGALDLNNNTLKDRHAFTGEDTSGNFVNYGKGAGAAQEIDDLDNIVADEQASYAILNGSDQQIEGADQLLADDSDAYHFVGGQSLGTTTTTESFLTVTLTVWLEGWAELGNPGSNLWSSDYNGLTFDLGLRFACEANA